MRSPATRAMGWACVAALWACPAAPEEEAPPPKAAAAKVAEAPAEAPKAAEAPAAEVPVPADFADEAAAEITEENFEAELEALAAEIEAAP